MPPTPRLPLPRLLGLPARTAGHLLRWPQESQQGSRRNAMVAATALAQRRAELREVEETLASLTSPDASAAVSSAQV